MGGWIDLSRYRALLTLGLAVVIALGAVDGAAALVVGPIQRPVLVDWDLLGRNGGEVRRAEELIRQGTLDPKNLVVVAGLSTVLRGLDASQLVQNDARRRDWMVLGGQGHSVRELEFYTEPLLESRLRPARVVIGIHRSFLFDGWKKIDAKEAGDSAAQAGGRRSLRRLPKDVLLLRWIRGYASEARDWTLIDVYDLRRAWLSFAGVGERAMFPAVADFHTPWSGLRPEARAPADKLASQWAGLTAACDPRGYQDNAPETAILVRLLGRLRDKGIPVSVLLMPEQSRWRAAYPPEAEASLQRALQEVPGGPVPVIDLRDALPDKSFYDYGHANARGLRGLSAMLPARVPADPKDGVPSRASALETPHAPAVMAATALPFDPRR